MSPQPGGCFWWLVTASAWLKPAVSCSLQLRCCECFVVGVTLGCVAEPRSSTGLGWSALHPVGENGLGGKQAGGVGYRVPSCSCLNCPNFR